MSQAKVIVDHNSQAQVSTRYTHKRGPWRLVRPKPILTRGEAMQRERFIKSCKSAAWIRKHLLNR